MEPGGTLSEYTQYSRYEARRMEKEHMSTQSLRPRRCNGLGRFAFALLIGAGLTLQCLLPSAAFARSRGSGAAFLANPLDHLSDKIGVSVVRLVVIYSDVQQSLLTCTGLGTLVESKLTDSVRGIYQNVVLTDGTLVSPGIASCGTAGSTSSLKSIEILASAEYTGLSATNNVLGKLNCTLQAGCADAVNETVTGISTNQNKSSTLFTFQSLAPEPYVNLDLITDTAPAVSYAVGLGQNGEAFPDLTVSNSEVPQNYLRPNAKQIADASSSPSGSTPAAFEPGTAVVDSSGILVALYLSDATLQPLSQASLKGSPLLSSDATSVVKAHWDPGIDAFYAQNYVAANRSFQPILTVNADFKAPQVFYSQSLLRAVPTATPRPKTPPPSSDSDLLVPFPLLLEIAGGVVVLLLLLMLILFGRSRRRKRELKRFEAEQLEAQRQAEEEVQRQRAQHFSTPPEVPCPNCRQPVRVGDTFCPFCRFPLSPSASGLGVRLAGNIPVPPVESAPPPPPPPPSVASISDQPTIHFPPNAEPPTIVPERTLKRGKSTKNIQQQKSQALPQVHGRNLQLVVGTRSDPGLKRKYKPNEDSLFAVQGARTHDSQPQQFGLFVVADGMGGHTNGQDASRQAIQTMIDFMLPRISGSEPINDDTFTRLLGEGVQQANQAVHQRNLEARADMGTTMTTSLVVGSTAYVANVGDSRTYLYRASQGLSRVTNDHSVVASLVEAGIIQPDDIYTHPKRNQIYRSLGEKPVVEVDTFKVELQPGDVLLLCSDGLWDMVRDPQIQQVLNQPAGDPNKIVQDLIKAALEGGGEDNVSAIVVQFMESEQHTGQTGIQLLTKPETVTLPNLPPV